MKAWLTSSFDTDDNEPVKAKRPKLEPTLCSGAETSAKNCYSLSRLSATIPKKVLTSLPAILDACNPHQSSELAISRQKQKEICDWLEYKTPAGKPSALVLSGPTGCGKTIAMTVLANEHGFESIEWITPLDQIAVENEYVRRQTDVFEDFLIRVTRYRSVLSSYTRRILLVKDFPNVYMKEKEAFENTLQKYFEMGREPVVFICTDVGGIGALQTLFPINVREKFGIHHISINSVTPAAIKNALKRIAPILNNLASDMICVSQAVIDEMLSNSIGDIRSTVLNLIFCSLKVPNSKKDESSRGRQESLGLLHAVGRVINPKRVCEGTSWKFAHDPDEITFFFQTQPTTFIGFIHENYLNTIRTIEEASTASHIISTADCLTAEWRDASLGCLGLSFCIRGVMLTNQKPVNGWNPVRKPHRDDAKISRTLAEAETSWYESLINPQSKASTLGNLKT